MTMRRKRLLWQFYPSYLLIMLASLLAVTWHASDELREFFHRQTAKDLEARARLLEQPLRKMLAAAQHEPIDALCKKLGPASATRITVILRSGEVVGDSEELPSNMDNHAKRPEVADAADGRIRPAIRYSYTLKQKMMYVALPIREEGATVAFVRTSIPVTDLDGPLRAIQWRIAGGGLLVALLAALVGWFVWSLICHFVGTRFLPEPLTRSNLAPLLRATGFAAAPGVIRVVGIVPLLGPIVTLVASLWMLAAFVVAVRQTLSYSTTGRAVAVCVVGWFIQWAVVGMFLMLGLGSAALMMS